MGTWEERKQEFMKERIHTAFKQWQEANKDERRTKNMLAARIGVHPNTVTKMMDGKISDQYIPKLCE